MRRMALWMGGLALAAAAPASADDWGFSLSIGRGAYAYDPGYVVVDRPAVYYDDYAACPPPVVYRPAPVVYRPAPAVYYDDCYRPPVVQTRVYRSSPRYYHSRAYVAPARPVYRHSGYFRPAPVRSYRAGAYFCR